MVAADPHLKFLVTISLHPGASRAAVEAALKGWCARVDREYLGRNWLKMPEKMMRGVAFFEAAPHNHAHLLVAPPVGASAFHFEMNAAQMFRPEAAPELRLVPPQALAQRGVMQIQSIGDSAEDRHRLAKYVTKEMEWREAALHDWAPLSELGR
ncbi:hypothetical protein NGM99_00255 [Mesorhizobium sp. RP14(2022)]|uniref:Uncharacterized protein n=1 Tax=Mesorhizobium liriopis TaxID=2953882 RepID=A0ABT1C057_9HYPH|nr:hypothetical protein [Mesorhizobium liriopis]MCO6048220.1 hypothetical protein [Mesorhizobium liriopis]